MPVRVMSVLEEFSPSLEVYFLDEVFPDLTGICQNEPITCGQNIRKTLFRNTGILEPWPPAV